MTALDTYLATRPDRCEHGYAPNQGCTDCGLRAKARGQAIATAANPDDRARVEAAIRQLAATGRPFSANDCRAVHGVVGPVVGAAFTALRQAGVIRRVGYEASTEPGTHAHPVAIWLGVAA